MNIRQQTHTKMFVAVLGVLDNFKTLWIKMFGIQAPTVNIFIFFSGMEMPW